MPVMEKALDHYLHLPIPLNKDGKILMDLFLNLFLLAAKGLNEPQSIAVEQLAMYCHVKLPCRNLCGCTNFKNNDSQERVDGNEIFNNNDYFREY